ncbi:dolichyl-phosphate beta-glucosyltransferase [Jiulongibacter sediminis]|uniref:Dolichyl-phosphate beta-glucosyltransferase n=2 Tax=Jiulongibacter sediminis TaxID=1605367 RepID=A0A0P7C5F6_9BACT|nr:dolichyl-phosphate beta-glucosyltransferase [Jiulongibacter sediminis]
MVVPCYNEETRFPATDFGRFLDANSNTLLCLVNDGSKDKTLEALKHFQSLYPSKVEVLNLQKNSGKSEAVRSGINHIFNNFRNIGLIGFLDADLATKPEEWVLMANYLDEHSRYGAIVGSRIPRLGADIERKDNRSVLSNIVKTFIRLILRTNFQDTQCGAKIFHRSLVPSLFGSNFNTPWLFDVEIFMRLKKKFGGNSLRKGVLEYPLLYWSEIGDSKLKLKDSVRIPLQLLMMYFQYNWSDKFKTKSGYSIFDKKHGLMLKNYN